MVPTSMPKLMVDGRHFIWLAQTDMEKMPSFHYGWKMVPTSMSKMTMDIRHFIMLAQVEK
jgi:hypothetical protein